MIFKPVSQVMLGGPGTLEPARSGYFEASFTGPDGQLDVESNYHLRAVSGLERVIESEIWQPGNFDVPIPSRRKPIVITLTYMLLVGDNLRSKVMEFWDKWLKKVYDVDKDLPALFSECTGSCSIKSHVAGQGASSPIPVLTVDVDFIWPDKIAFDPFDRDSSEPVKFTVTLNGLNAKFTGSD